MRGQWIALALTMLVVPLAASAQPETPPPPPATTPVPDPGDAETVTVDVGEFMLELSANEALTACVIEARTDLDGAYTTVVVFVRGMDDVVYPLGRYETRATAALDGAIVGDCRVLG